MKHSIIGNQIIGGRATVFGGAVAITGDTAGFAVYDRTNGANLWQFYSTGNTFRFYKNHGSGNAEPLTISASGVVTASAGVIQSPPASATPANNGQMLFEATSNTSVTLKLKGTDGTVRKVVLTLAP